MSTAHNFVLDALMREPKPIDEVRALEIGLKATQEVGQNTHQFELWFKSNWKHFLKMLNGE